MKLLMSMVAIAVLLVGCGNNSQTSTKSSANKKNYIAEGMAALGNSDVKNALKNFDMAIKQDPTNVENYLVLSQVYLKLNQPARAVDTLNAAVRVAPGNGQVFYMMSLAQQLQGDHEKAVLAAQKSVEIYLASKDEENLKNSLVLLKSLTDAPAQE